MCYSAQIWADYRKYERFGGDLSIKEYTAMAGWTRQQRTWIKAVPKALRDVSESSSGAVDIELSRIASEAEADGVADIVVEMEIQIERQAEATAKLASAKPTKKAANDLRVSTNKIEAARRKLAQLNQAAPADGIDRIWPGHFAPVLIRDPKTGDFVTAPMRYRCRLPGWTEATEIKKPGTYNARRDRLTSVWKKEFGTRHGVIAVRRFYESVKVHDLQRRALVPGEREQKTEIIFTPQSGEDLFVACLWEYTPGTDIDPELYSFAIVTDHPPPEVAIAGHDRCIVSLREDDIEAWLSPIGRSRSELQAILDRGEQLRPYFEHELARPIPETVE